MMTKRNLLSMSFTAALLVSGAYLLTTRHAHAQSEGESQAPVQYTWEYAELYILESPSKKQTRILFLPPNKTPPVFDQGILGPDETYYSALDVLGNLGWEMIQVRSGGGHTEPFQTIYHFKRRKI